MQKKPKAGRRLGAGRPSNLTVSREKNPEPWIPGVSEISDQELLENTPVAVRMALLKAVEAYERGDRAHLTDCYRELLLAEGVAEEGLPAVTQKKDIDQLYEALEATHDVGGILADVRVQFQNIILQTAARACSRFRAHQIGRSVKGNKQRAETEAKVRKRMAERMELDPSMGVSAAHAQVAEDFGIDIRTVQRRLRNR